MKASHSLDLSVILATFRRDSILGQTLEAMTALDTARLQWELVVVDNAGDGDTQEVCQRYSCKLPLRCIVCTTPGKTAALNLGVKALSGDLVVLTDDDVLPARDWLQAMSEGARRWPDHVVFGGRVLPHWPTTPPEFARNPEWERWTYSVHDPQIAEGECADPRPIGPNMAVRRSVFQAGLTYNEAMGPNGVKHFTLGDEDDLVRRLMRQGSTPVFLPRSVVHHIIRPEQLTHEWLLKRAFHQGRGEALLGPQATWYQVARLTKHLIWSRAAYYRAALGPDKANAFRRRMGSAVARGKLYQSLRAKLNPSS